MLSVQIYHFWSVDTFFSLINYAYFGLLYTAFAMVFDTCIYDTTSYIELFCFYFWLKEMRKYDLCTDT